MVEKGASDDSLNSQEEGSGESEGLVEVECGSEQEDLESGAFFECI